MKKRVLVVDDDPSTRRLLAELMRDYNVDVYEAGRDEEAYQRFLEIGPDLVFVDVLLPRQGGVTLLRRLRGVRGGKEVPVLGMSGVYRGADIRRELVDELGAVDFLKKPFSMSQIKEILDRFLQEAAEPDEEPVHPFLQDDLLSRGSLTSMDLPVAFHELATHRATGCLHLKSGRARKVIHVREGQVTFALSNRLPETLGRYLIARGMIEEDAYRQALETMQADGKRLGEILLSRGLLSVDEIADAIRENIREKILDLFTWPTGDFRVADYMDPPAVLPGQPFDLFALLWEGVRTRFPFDRVTSALAPYSDLMLVGCRDLFELASEVSLEKEDLQFLRVLRRLRGKSLSQTLHEVKGEGEVRTLYYLVLRGFLGFARVGTEGAGLSGLDETDRERLRRARRKLESMRGRNHFQVLEVSLNTSDEQVRQAYLQRAKDVHPDMLSPSDPPSLHQIHGELFRLNQAAYEGLKTEARRKDYLRFLQEGPDEEPDADGSQVLEAETCFQKGRFHLNRRQWDEAAEAFQNALDLNPDEGEYVLNLGIARARQAAAGRLGALDEAEELFRRARELLPSAPEPCYRLGRIRALRGDADGSALMFRAALQRDPHHVDAQRELRLAQMRTEKKTGMFSRLKGKG